MRKMQVSDRKTGDFTVHFLHFAPFLGNWQLLKPKSARHLNKKQKLFSS